MLIIQTAQYMESNTTDRQAVRIALKYYYAFKLAQVGCCGLSIYLGYSLFIAGVTGQASLTVDSETVSGQLLNAAPGLFFAVGGVVGLVCSIIKGVQVSLGEPERGGLGLQTLGRGTRLHE